VKTRYEIVSPDGMLILASVTLYGDVDSDGESDRVLMWLIREALSIAHIRNGSNFVTVRRTQVDT